MVAEMALQWVASMVAWMASLKVVTTVASTGGTWAAALAALMAC